MEQATDRNGVSLLDKQTLYDLMGNPCFTGEERHRMGVWWKEDKVTPDICKQLIQKAEVRIAEAKQHRIAEAKQKAEVEVETCDDDVTKETAESVARNTLIGQVLLEGEAEWQAIEARFYAARTTVGLPTLENSEMEYVMDTAQPEGDDDKGWSVTQDEPEGNRQYAGGMKIDRRADYFHRMGRSQFGNDEEVILNADG